MIVAYTAIFGGSDSLKRAPAADRCYCYTDEPGFHGFRYSETAKPFSPGWEIIARPPEASPRRAARILKMKPQQWFPQATASVWVDGSIEIKDWPGLMADCADADIACLPHPDRNSCYDEGAAVVRLKIAHADRVTAALDLYRADGFAPTRLSTTGLLYRRNTEKVAAFNRLWRDHLDAYGTNDQVHFDYCAWKTGVQVTYLRGHYRDNPYAKYDQADHHRRRKPQFLLEADCAHYLA